MPRSAGNRDLQFQSSFSHRQRQYHSDGQDRGKLVSAEIKNNGQKSEAEVLYAGKTVHLSFAAGQKQLLNAQLALN